MDLEQEFSKLVEGMRDTVRTKLANGELSKTEASALEDMITERLEGWDGSTCYTDDEDYNDDGWQPSQVCW